jgi:PAS domain S-box-containing protein
MATPDGNMVAASIPFIPGSVNLSDRRHIREAIRTLDFSAGEDVMGRVSKIPSLNFTHPVLDRNGKLVAIVIAAFNLNEYYRYITRIQMPEGSAVSITDHQGIRLFRWPEQIAAAIGKSIPKEALVQTRGVSQGIFRHKSDDGINRIYAFKQMRLREGVSPYLYMFVGLKEESVLHEANVRMITHVTIVGLAGFLAATLTWLLVSLIIVRPIHSLSVAALSLGRGERGVRTRLPHSAGAIGRLADSFDSMATMLDAREKERDEAEQALRLAHAELEDRIREGTAELSVRKQLESELRAANEEQRAIFDSATTGIVLIRDRVILRCNRKIEEIFGYDPSELLGKTTRCWYEGDDTYAEMGREVAGQLADPGIFRKERLLLRKDETRFWGRMTAQSVDKSDTSLELVYIIEDITAEREVAESLRIAKENAERASHAKDDHISNVSHELRTPMTTIREGVSQVLDGILGPTTEAQREFLGIVQDDTERLSRVINDLLDISKIEAGQLKIHKEHVDMIRIAQQVAKISKPQADAKNLQIKTDFATSIIEAYIDPDKIFQVWHNLVNNALKFTKQGLVELSIKEQENLVICTVKDTGVGIRTEDIPNIFNKFYQSTRKNKGHGEKGTGLGLAIARAIIESHGGLLSVESVLGQGSIFRFEIPKASL